jgi:hypothetical protein
VAKTAIRDYDGQMDLINFETFPKTLLFDWSVVILDNTPYHHKQEDKSPSRYGAKAESIACFQR